MAFRKKRLGDLAFDIPNYVILFIFAISALYPFINLLSVSFSSPAAANNYGLKLIPEEFTIDAYRQVFKNEYIWMGYSNTIFRTVVGTFLNIVFTVMCAYPLSKKYLPCRNTFTSLIVFTMFFSGGLIPEFLLMQKLHLMDNRAVLILPGLISAYTMILVRNYFMALPAEIEESAKMDGANDILILFKIVLPISLPIIATFSLWYGVSHWNAWFDCLLYITSPKKTVLQTVLQKIIIQNSNQFIEMSQFDASANNQVTPETVKAATVMVATIPIICVYPFIQKYFVKGIMVGSLKG